MLVTNHHVIEGAYFAEVVTTDQRRLFVEGIVADDSDVDLAILKVNASELPFLKLTHEFPQIGAKVYAIGNPEGFTNTLSDGLISGLRILSGQEMIQTTAPISHGSSGGPLLSETCNVIGITRLFFIDGQNLNFAIPANRVSELIKKKGVVKPLASAGAAPLQAQDAHIFDEVFKAIANKDEGTALKLLAKLRDSQGHSAYYWDIIGEIHYHLKNYDLAIDAYRTAIKIDPQSAVLWQSLGCALGLLNKDEDAIEAFTKSNSIEENAETYCLIGHSLGYLGRREEESESYRSAISLDPQNFIAYNSLAAVYVDLKRYDDALAACRTALKLTSKDASDYILLAETLNQLGQNVEAIQACKLALEIDPKSSEAYSQLGLIYKDLHRYSDAITACNYSIALASDSASAHVILGIVLVSSNRQREAIPVLQRAIALDPNGSDGALARKWLASITQR